MFLLSLLFPILIFLNNKIPSPSPIKKKNLGSLDHCVSCSSPLFLKNNLCTADCSNGLTEAYYGQTETLTC